MTLEEKLKEKSWQIKRTHDLDTSNNETVDMLTVKDALSICKQEIGRAISISKNAKVKVDFTELLKDKIKEIRRIKDQTPKGNIMYKEKMMMGTYGILICKDLLSKLKNRISV